MFQSPKNNKPPLKTKKNRVVVKLPSLLLAAFWVFFASCQNNSILNAGDTQNVSAESASAFYLNESADIAAIVLGGITPSQYNAGGVSGVSITGLSLLDDRLGTCATVTLTTTGTADAPAGKITIHYDTCADSYGVIRKGQIVIDYVGQRWTPAQTLQIKMVNFYRNYDHLEGTLTLTPQTSSTDTLHVQFNSVLDSGKVTFGDGQLITRTHNLTREWVRSIASSSNNQWITFAGGTASGNTKGGKNYTVQITKQLVEKVTCRADKVFIPVTGTKIITVGNAKYTVDYGTGSCDKNIISVTLNGKAEQVTVTAEGN